MTIGDQFHTTTARDTLDLLTGRWLGNGIHREVWECAIDESLVVKFETEKGSFRNIYEHELWEEVRYDKELSKWFAPIVSISPNGVVLLQKRTQPVRIEELPQKVPAFFSDLKVANWGMYDGRIVCHDYGNNAVTRTGLTRRMKKADWW